MDKTPQPPGAGLQEQNRNSQYRRVGERRLVGGTINVVPLLDLK